jgi:uncharacterized protein YpiB (UPF0302 family)
MKMKGSLRDLANRINDKTTDVTNEMSEDVIIGKPLTAEQLWLRIDQSLDQKNQPLFISLSKQYQKQKKLNKLHSKTR